MRRLSIALIGLLISMGIYAGEREDVVFLQELYNQKKYSMAIEQSKKFIQTYPRSKYKTTIQERMGKAYILEKNYLEAITTLNGILKITKLTQEQLNNIYSDLAKAYAALKDYNTANIAIDKITKGSQAYLDAILAVGKEQIKNKDYTEAQTQLKKAIGVQSLNTDELVINLALAAYNNSEYLRTIIYLDELYKGNEVELVNYLYGTSYYILNDNEKALIYFNRIIDSPSESSYKTNSKLSSIEIYLKQKKEENALGILNTIKAPSATYDKALKSFGSYFLLEGNSEKALEYYAKSSNKKNPEIIYGLAVAQYRTGKLTEALSNFKLLEKTSYKSEGLYYQFLIQYQNKNYKYVVDNIKLVDGLKLTPQEKLSLNSIIAVSAYEEKAYDISYSYYLKNYELNETKENLYKTIIAANESRNSAEIHRLIKIYEEKFATDQEYKKNITLVLAQQYVRENKPKAAMELYQNYLEKDRDNEILENLINLKLSEQNYAEALDYLKLQDISLKNTYLQGIAKIGMGNYDEAEVLFNQVLETQDKTKLTSELQSKTTYNVIRNYFLWGKYSDVVQKGEEYIQSDKILNLEDVVDKVAISYFRMDNPIKAREYFEKLKLIPNMADYAQFQIGETYYSEKEYAKAIEAYEITEKTSKDLNFKEKALYWQVSSYYLLKDELNFEIKSSEYLGDYPTAELKDNVVLMRAQLYSEIDNIDESLKSYEKLYSETTDENLKEEALLKVIDIFKNKSEYSKELEWINKITNEDKKNFYMAEYYKNQKQMEAFKLELDKLIVGEEYRDYAAIELGDYYLSKESLEEAKKSYENILGMESSAYKDRALFQIANINQKTDKINEAIVEYTKIFVLYPNSKYALESQIRVAELYEKNEQFKNAITEYKSLLNSGSSNKNYFLEKLIYLNLKTENTEEAKKYYTELESADSTLSEKYKNFF